MYDLLITSVNLYLGKGEVLIGKDVAIKDGIIAAVLPGESHVQAKEYLDASNKLMVPSFMDTHMHIDKAFTMEDDNTISLIYACSNSERMSSFYYDWTDEEIYDEILSHSEKIVRWCIKNGTTKLKTNVLFTPTWKTIALDAMMALKKKYKNYCDVLNVVSFPMEYRQELLCAAKDGKVDFVGGYPHLMPDYKADTEDCFKLAKELDLPLDLHCDESDVVDLNCFHYIINQTNKYGFQGHVTCGHVTGLNATNIPEEMAADAIKAAAQADVSVTSLTSCNMYLMNSTRRGPTRVRQLLDSGVNVAVASDNVRDTFRPFGNCDLLEEALLTAKVHKFGTSSDLRRVMDLVTYNAAKNAEAKNYGLKEGCFADFNILEASLPEEAIINHAEKSYVFRNGRIIAKSGEIIDSYLC